MDTNLKPWIVRCRVSGGVTGTREAVLKSGGVTARFRTEDEAAAEAARLRAVMNGPFAGAHFQYWPELAPVTL